MMRGFPCIASSGIEMVDFFSRFGRVVHLKAECFIFRSRLQKKGFFW